MTRETKVREQVQQRVSGQSVTTIHRKRVHCSKTRLVFSKRKQAIGAINSTSPMVEVLLRDADDENDED